MSITRKVASDVRVALVTGSSRGLGRHIAERLAASGFRVTVNGLRGDPQAEYTAQAIRMKGHAAEAVCGDVTDEGQVSELVAEVTSRVGPIDVLVVNATGPQPEAPISATRWAEYLEQLRFFVKSPVLLGRLVIPGMQDRRFGRIINIDSDVADRPPLDRSAYVTAKNAQIGLTLSWARELASYGITVNSVAPGFIPVERHSHLPPERFHQYLQSVPAGRMGVPDDVAHAVNFFASPEASFITGQRIVVDGGRRLAG